MMYNKKKYGELKLLILYLKAYLPVPQDKIKPAVIWTNNGRYKT